LIATARHRATRQKDAQLAACGVGGFKAAFLANVPIEFNRAGALEQDCGQTSALRDKFGDVQHGCEEHCPKKNVEMIEQKPCLPSSCSLETLTKSLLVELAQC
jgi:hypothetical protein